MSKKSQGTSFQSTCWSSRTPISQLVFEVLYVPRVREDSLEHKLITVPREGRLEAKCERLSVNFIAKVKEMDDFVILVRKQFKTLII